MIKLSLIFPPIYVSAEGNKQGSKARLMKREGNRLMKNYNHFSDNTMTLKITMRKVHPV